MAKQMAAIISIRPQSPPHRQEKYHNLKQTSFSNRRDIRLTCCQEKHFSVTAPNKSPSYVHGRKSFARCCCLFYKSPFDLRLFPLDLTNFSHTHHIEKNQDIVNLAKKYLAVLVNTTVPTCVLIYESSLIADRD